MDLGARVPGGGAMIVRSDDGTTLTELLVAIGVFSVLMILVGSGMTAVFRGIADTRAYSDTEQDQRNAMLWISRAVRYADEIDPPNYADPFLVAETGTFTFRTYAGLGDSADAPYLVTVENSPEGVVSRVTGPGADSERVLIATGPRRQPTVEFEYWCVDTSIADDTLVVCPTDDTTILQSQLREVVVTLRDEGGIFTEQGIVLVNRR